MTLGTIMAVTSKLFLAGSIYDIPLADKNLISFFLLHGQRVGVPEAPVAFETEFSWVLAGNTNASASTSTTQVATHDVVHQSNPKVLGD